MFSGDAQNSNPLQNQNKSNYKVGDVIDVRGSKYRVTGLDDPTDPDLEPA